MVVVVVVVVIVVSPRPSRASPRLRAAVVRY
jgi:hypothetical protein